MKMLMTIAVLVALMMPMEAKALTFHLSESYSVEEATGLVRNTTGAYQGPGAGTGLLYGPFATVTTDTGFTVAKVLSWYGAVQSRVGGDSTPEGSKMSVSGGVSPLTVMGVSFVVGYNVVDGSVTWGAVTSLKELAARILSR